MLPSCKALFLDRDGVINIDYGYVHTPDSFHFVDGIFTLVNLARVNGYKIIVVTNQAGIGRGYYTEDDFLALTKWMETIFLKAGAPIDKVYYSPFHPIHGIGSYLRDDYSRKPNPGMIFNARSDFNINLKESILIGDSSTDILAANAAGIGTKLFLSPDLSEDLSSINYHLISCLSCAHRFIDFNHSLNSIV